MTTVSHEGILDSVIPTFFRSGYDSTINGPVGLGGRQTFNLRNVEVRVYLGALVFPPSRIYQYTGPGLEIRFNRLNLIPKLGTELTVWIRIGATPVFWYLVLKPLRIALVPLRWSASA